MCSHSDYPETPQRTSPPPNALPSRPKVQPPQSEGAGRGLDPLLGGQKTRGTPPPPPIAYRDTPPTHTLSSAPPPPSLKGTRQPGLGVGSRGARWRARQSGARPDQGWAPTAEGDCDSPPTWYRPRDTPTSTTERSATLCTTSAAAASQQTLPGPLQVIHHRSAKPRWAHPQGRPPRSGYAEPAPPPPHPTRRPWVLRGSGHGFMAPTARDQGVRVQ